LLAISALFGWDVYSLDVTQAFLQSAERLKREIVICPDVLELRKDELLQIMLPLYGLSESGDYWAETLGNHMLNKLQLKQSAADMSLFFRQKGRELSGMIGSYVDDLLCASPRELQKEHEREFTEQFECKDSRDLPTTFLGMDLAKTLTGFVSGMQQYILRLCDLHKDASFDEFRTLRAKLLWIHNARPDIAAYCSIASAVTVKQFNPADVAAINDIVYYLKRTVAYRLHFPKLDINSLSLAVYCDAAFGNRVDGSSQLGYII
jgi:Reverse transcriptase (RNA-dependent DNA polymerase)